MYDDTEILDPFGLTHPFFVSDKQKRFSFHQVRVASVRFTKPRHVGGSLN